MTIEIPLSVLIALFAINGGTLTAFIGVIALLTLRLGRLPTREEHNELRDELKADMTGLRNELKAGTAGLREDFRRSHQQLLTALAGHAHNEDGQAVFTTPPELDTMPTPADD